MMEKCIFAHYPHNLVFMIRKHFGIILGFLSLVFSAGAQQEKQVFHFLNLPATAQALAAGGKAITIVDDNPGLAFENPALLGYESGGRAFLSYLYYMSGSHMGNACYASSVGERGMWGVGTRFLNYGSMQGYDPNAIETGSFSASDIAVQGFYSHELSNHFRGGVSLKALYSSIETYSSLGLGVDVGISYYDDDKGYSASALFKNVGAQLKGYNDEREPLDWDFQLGFSRSFINAPFRLHITLFNLNPHYFKRLVPRDLTKMQKFLRHFSLGAEFTPSEKFWVGLGYTPQIAQDFEVEGGNKWGGLSAGVGFTSGAVRVGVSAATYHPAALSFMCSVGIRLDDKSIF